MPEGLAKERHFAAALSVVYSVAWDQTGYTLACTQ
jgi:hypothetical protein